MRKKCPGCGAEISLDGVTAEAQAVAAQRRMAVSCMACDEPLPWTLDELRAA
jgi:hypothetical protein